MPRFEKNVPVIEKTMQVLTDPEFSYTTNGNPMVSLRLWVSDTSSNAQYKPAEFAIDALAFHELAEEIHSSGVQKGDMLGVKGELRSKSRQAQNGKTYLSQTLYLDSACIMVPLSCQQEDTPAAQSNQDFGSSTQPPF